MKQNLFFLCLMCCLALTGCTSDKNIQTIMKAAKIKQPVAEKFFHQLQAVNYNEFTSLDCKHHGTEYFFCTAKNYNYFADGGIMISLTPEGVITEITNYKNDLFKNGKVIASFTDYSISVNDFMYLIKQSEETAKKTLKAPSSAVFPNWKEWSASFTKDTVSISAYVDSQNGFGAMLRSPLNFTYNRRKKYDGTFQYTLNNALIGTIIVK